MLLELSLDIDNDELSSVDDRPCYTTVLSQQHSQRVCRVARRASKYCYLLAENCWTHRTGTVNQQPTSTAAGSRSESNLSRSPLLIIFFRDFRFFFFPPFFILFYFIRYSVLLHRQENKGAVGSWCKKRCVHPSLVASPSWCVIIFRFLDRGYAAGWVPLSMSALC